jgi:hypothetical protein
LKRYHRWASVYFYYSPTFPRLLRVLILATNVICILFLQAIMYDFINPDWGVMDTSTCSSTSTLAVLPTRPPSLLLVMIPMQATTVCLMSVRKRCALLCSLLFCENESESEVHGSFGNPPPYPWFFSVVVFEGALGLTQACLQMELGQCGVWIHCPGCIR